jgi:polar amino acid transport system substrate-binding protein
MTPAPTSIGGDRVSRWREIRRLRAVRVLLAGLVMLFVASPVSGGEGLQTVSRRGTLIWGADQEGGGPFVFPAADEPGRLVGFEVELAETIAARLGVKAQFAQGQWDKLPDLLDRGDIDIVLNGYEWTPDRARRYGTSIPYYIYELQLLGRKDNASLRSWEDILNPAGGQKRISVLGGSAAHDYLVEHAGDMAEVVLFDGATDAMRAAEIGIDGIGGNLQDLPVWTFYRDGFPGLTPVGEPVGRGYYVALVRKDDTELLQAVNDAILAALRDGTLRRIFAKYGLWNAAQANRALETAPDGSFVGDTTRVRDGADETQGDQEPKVESYSAVRGWGVVRQRGWLLVRAAGMTVALSVAAMPLAIMAGLSIALVRLYGPWLIGKPAAVYVELVRGTPLVLQLYVIFFLLPEIGLSIHAFWAAVIGLAINYSAYEAEIYRAGLQAIPRGQMEAALALGMSRNLALRRVIVPQATRLVIPPVTNDFIALFKDTAVCSVITVVELSKEYYIQARSTGAIVELGLLTALLYLAMSYPLSVVAAALERRMAHDRRA